MRRRLLPLPLALLLACGPANSPSPSAPEVATGTVSGHGLTLSVAAEPAVVAAGQPIDVEAVVTNDGTEPIVVSGSGSGFVVFSVTRLDDGLTSGEPVTTDDCARHVVPAGGRTVIPFAKSGGWSEDDPNAAFLRTYFADPELTLPSGSWRVDVATRGNLGEGCTGPPLVLEISLIVTVTE